MDKEIKTTEELDTETKEILARVEASLRKQIADGEKYGFDIRKHWEEMLDSLEEEKAERK